MTISLRYFQSIDGVTGNVITQDFSIPDYVSSNVSTQTPINRANVNFVGTNWPAAPYDPTQVANTSNVQGYGGYVQQSVVSLMENFASTSSNSLPIANIGPENPFYGQLWSDTGSANLSNVTFSNRSNVVLRAFNRAVSGGSVTKTAYDWTEVTLQNDQHMASNIYIDSRGTAGNSNSFLHASNVANANVTLLGNGFANIGNVLVRNDLTLAGNFLPNANSVSDLGSPTKRWKDLWLSNTTIHVGDGTISSTDGNGMSGSGNVVISNGLKALGALVANSTLTVNGTSTFSNPVTINATLTQNGVATFSNGNVSFGNSISVAGNSSVTGNSTVTGNLSVTSNISIGGAGGVMVNANGTITVGTGANLVTIGGGAVTTANTAAPLSAKGSDTQVQYNSSGNLAGSANFVFNGTTVTITGDLAVSKTVTGGNLSTGGTLSVTSTSTLTGATTHGSTVTGIQGGTAGAGSIGSQSLRVTNGGMGISGDSYISGSLGVATNISAGGTLSVTGTSTLTGAQTLTGATTHGSTVTGITGGTASSGSVASQSLRVASGGLGVNGDSYISGSLGVSTNLGVGGSAQINSLGIGTGASGTAGEIRATNNITAYYSDDRLKTRLGKIENALDKVDQLTGFYYEANETAQALGYEAKREVGVSAQDTQAVMAEIVAPAPIDEQYLTVRYEKFAPLLIEAIKELRAEVNDIKAQLTKLID